MKKYLSYLIVTLVVIFGIVQLNTAITESPEALPMKSVSLNATTTLGARTESPWVERLGTFLETPWAEGRDILINGVDKFLNFNEFSGESGYGFRDFVGTMQFKNDGGDWTTFGTGSGGATSTLADVSVVSLTTAQSLYTMTTLIDVEFEDSANATVLYLDESSGDVGIGIAAPLDGTLHVQTASAGATGSTSSADDLTVENSADAGITILTPDANISALNFGSPNRQTGAFLRWQNSTQLFNIGTGDTDGEISFDTGLSFERMRIDSLGNVGIGTTTPAFKLDVEGFIDVDGTIGGYRIDGNLILQASSTNSSTLVGDGAGVSVTGVSNTAVGKNALNALTSGLNNVAVGYHAGKDLTGSSNVYIGSQAGEDSGNASSNVFLGTAAGVNNTGGDDGVLIGRGAGFTNTTSNRNTAIGRDAGFLMTGANNILLGYHAANSLTSGANNLIIGYDIEAPSNTASNQLNIGNLIFSEGIDGTGTTLSSGNIGIGTTSPYAKLSVVGEVVAAFFSATSTTATSSFAGGVTFGAFDTRYEVGSNSLHVDNLFTGPQAFDEDAGILSWINLPVSATPADGTIQSYSAQIDGNSVFTVYGEADSSGGADTLRFGIGTTTPGMLFDIFSTGTTSSRVDSNSATKGSCDVRKDFDGGGYSYITYLNGVQTVSTISCL